VLRSSRGENEKGLVFKVKWIDTNDVAFMPFDMAKKKYPLTVLDYLVSRIKQRPTANMDSEGSIPLKKIINSPVTQCSDSSKTQEQKNEESEIDKFFTHCVFCTSAKSSGKMLDCDALIPIEKNFAYPVVFRLGKK
jgi:hypothetical protein